jgi:hypothetical protein
MDLRIGRMPMTRRNALVCQYVENLSSAALERYAPIIRAIVGRRHGVYALYRRDKLYYVGLATNLRSRLKTHLKDRHRGLWDRFSVYLTIDDGHLKELESLVLRIVRPKGNKQKGKFTRSENLLPTIRRQLRLQQRQEMLALIGREMKLIARNNGDLPKRNGRQPVLAGYVNRAVSLQAAYKGKVYKARVRKNGTIRVGREIFMSPSLAAVAVVGKPTNGWWFWKYERAPGQWVRLRELRRR